MSLQSPGNSSEAISGKREQKRTTTVDRYVVVVTLLGERNPRKIRHPRLVVSSLGCPPGQISLRLASKARAPPLAPRVGTALPRCSQLHVVSGIAIGKTGMFPSSRTPEGLTPDSLGSSSVACRLGCLLRKLSQTRARPTRLTAAQPTSAATRPGFSLCRCRSRANSSQLARRSPAPLTLAQPVYAVPDPLARLPSAFPPPAHASPLARLAVRLPLRSSSVVLIPPFIPPVSSLTAIQGSEPITTGATTTTT
ncbi:hypothetical protein VTN00DRAFT_4559 [Thermoascus crustaceus]|uniref:uncharacterized protein n=1 Tax=Thermoascus crustaceus TaxID=5088 RepID=UPI0037438B2B